MRRFLDRLYLASGAIGALFVLCIFLLMIGQTVLRQFGVATGAVNDVVAWSCAAASFFAMAHAFKHGDFVRVTLLLEQLSPRPRHWLEMACLAIGALCVGYLTWWAIRFTYESWAFKEVAQGLLPIPIWIPQASFAIGSVLLFVAVVDELVRVLRGRKPSYVEAVEERHARGDYSSDV
ncbi:MAG TPA: TRAP transporter small permease [Ramlibacter sp.]|uniref:TRAP transporter small permease n=1 Tax=Ramlibacter sp. TaxID=1917967 RepID=UPI002ECFF018